METWHIRHGSLEFFGQYQDAAGETPISEMPKSERPWGYGQEWFKSPGTHPHVKAFIEKYLRDKKVEVSDKPINCKR